MNIDDNTPFYPISMAAQLVGVTSDRLRTYEEEALIKPYRTPKGKRLFSMNDIKYLTCIRKLVHEHGISLKGIKLLQEFISCDEIMKRVGEYPDCKDCSYKGKKL